MAATWIFPMNDTLLKPLPNRRRKRWRWLVAGLLLAGGASLWWFWPVGDSRFIGHWRSQHGRSDSWEFRRNGIAVCHMISPASPNPITAYTTWRVQNNILQLGDPLINEGRGWRAWAVHQWNNLLPFNHWIVPSVRFRVVEASPDKLVLLSTDFLTADGDTETLSRIPD
jgi:hypothetical protein